MNLHLNTIWNTYIKRVRFGRSDLLHKMPIETGCTSGQKRLCPNQQISGSVVEFIAGPSKRHHQEQWFTHIVRAVGEYLVRFDNGEERECASNILKVEHVAASLLPDIPLPTPQNAREETLMETSIWEVEADAAEVEDLPSASPEEEEMEHEVEANGEEEEQLEQQPDNEGRMPSQLLTAEQSTVKDYHSIKPAAQEKIAALIGQEVTISNRSNGSMKWTVIETYEPPEKNLIQDINLSQKYGLKNSSISDNKRKVICWLKCFWTLHL
jgi:hypothetical protein